MSGRRILVVGESCQDIFVYCDASRLAPDVPVPVLRVLRETSNPGMAMNVERNIRALYPNCDLVTNANWAEIKKTRYMHDLTNHAFVRVDAGNLGGRVNLQALSLDKYDIIAVSDYDKGYLEREDIRYICERHDTVFVDTKKPVGGFLEHCRFIKINEKEYRRSRPVPPELEAKIIMTKAERGAEYLGVTYPVDQIEVKDVSGAGDSFFAALIVGYAETADIVASIKFANMCASQVVQHRGVTVIVRPGAIT